MTFQAQKVTDEILGQTHIHVCVNGGATFGVLNRVWDETSPTHDPEWKARLRSQIERAYEPRTDAPYGAFTAEDVEAFDEALEAV